MYDVEVLADFHSWPNQVPGVSLGSGLASLIKVGVVQFSIRECLKSSGAAVFCYM